MLNRIVIIGSGLIGKSLYNHLKSFELNVKLISSTIDNLDDDIIFWDYYGDIPSAIINADLVINAGRSNDRLGNIAFVKRLLDVSNRKFKLLQFSSVAVLSCPKGLFRFFYRGDAYVREKLAIEKLVRNASDACFLRPGVIIELGSSWHSYFHNKNKHIHVVLLNPDAYIDITSCSVINSFLLKYISDGAPCNVVDNLNSKVPINSIFAMPIIKGKTSNNFFDNYFKNFLFSLYVSKFIPDFLIFILDRVKSRTLNISETSLNLDVPLFEGPATVDGMARLYLNGVLRG